MGRRPMQQKAPGPFANRLSRPSAATKQGLKRQGEYQDNVKRGRRRETSTSHATMAALYDEYMDISDNGRVSVEMFDDNEPDDSDDSDSGASIDGRLGLGGLFSGSGESQAPGAVPRISDAPSSGPEGSYMSVDEPLQHEAHPTGYPENTQLQNTAYYQDASTFVYPGAPLWRLPQVDPPAGGIRSCSYLLRQLPATAEELVLRSNERSSKILPRITPYSLVLLRQLGMLSSYSNKNMLAVHVILHHHWQQRLASRNIHGPISSGLRSFQTIRPAQNISKYPGKGGHCETEIQENIYGITLQDTCATLRSIKRAVAGANEADDQPAPSSELTSSKLVKEATGINSSTTDVSVGTALRELQATRRAKKTAKRRRRALRSEVRRPLMTDHNNMMRDHVGGILMPEVPGPPSSELSRHENLMLREREQQNRVARIELRERVQDLQVAVRQLTKGEREACTQPALLRTQLTSAEEVSKQVSQSMASGLRFEVDPSQQDAATRARLGSLAQTGGLSDVRPREQLPGLDNNTHGTQPTQLPIRALGASHTTLHNGAEMRAEETTGMRAIELERLGQKPLPQVPMPWPKKASTTGKKWYDS
ncbi:hypothetical protein LTR91_013617 [Friedmanniomyces endolithicus]|uniref:Uncharacterized protein n=1 Tax=Friedmanniomyces endolithicus TaxID=329885 RepID=A0AAN6QNZ8_9PEZI|nr:hypothetical protein LTR57_016319 [Friedmanniomyces endolithicus]KAK0969587.1 hypothetical protein LTS01_016191 [Friedmanniomyces endolithicus]KAK0976583.1 hypothetical protein LTR91_013617 [Friedmanniomyces endolithicus]KAK1035342.1 hypothetical protein LTS16_014674 [Friedmanniomyces endolithicus]